MLVKNISFSNPAFISAFTKLMNASLPVKASFSVRRMVNVLQEPSKTYEEARVALVKKHGTSSADGKEIRVMPENVLEFAKEHEELLAIGSELPVEKISVKVSDFGAEDRLTAAEIELVKDFVEITE